MSGAQPKAGNIAGVVSVIAEVNPGRSPPVIHRGGLMRFMMTSPFWLTGSKGMADGEAVSLAYHGNIVDLWERFAEEGLWADLGSDQTSLHNPWAGGYYPPGITFDEANTMMADDPEKFRMMVAVFAASPGGCHQPAYRARHLLLRLRQCLPARGIACRGGYIRW